MQQAPAVAGVFPPFLNRGNKQISRTVVFGDRGSKKEEQAELDSWEEEPHAAPTMVPLFSSEKSPPLERQNSLLNDVRCRLEKLRAEQRKKDLEESHQRKKDEMERALVDEEVQKLVTTRIREMSLLEESRSVQSRQSSQGRFLRTAGSASPSHGIKLSIRASSTPIRSLNTLGSDSFSPQSRATSRSDKFAGVRTFPSVAASRSGEEASTLSKTCSVHSASVSSDLNDLDSCLDDISEMGSQNSYSTYSRVKRQPLIVIRAADVNKTRIKAEVLEHFPSPEKILEDDTFTSAAFPALYRRNTHRVDSFGRMTPPHPQSPSKGGSGGSDGAPSPLRPAPFLKTKSRSRILFAHGIGEGPSLERADSSSIVVGIARSHLLQRNNTRRNHSQRFNVRREDSTIISLQSPGILDSRYRGWKAASPSGSSKHDNKTNFY